MLHALNPFIRFMRRLYALEPTACVSVCYDCRLFYLKKAQGHILINGVSHDLASGTLLFLPPATRYRFHFDNWSDLDLIVADFDPTGEHHAQASSLHTATEADFDPSRALRYADMDGTLAHPLLLRNAEKNARDLESACQELLYQSAYARERASALLKLTLLDMLRSDAQSAGDPAIVNAVLHRIHADYADSSLTNERIAESLGYHPYYLSRLMKRATGRTLHQTLLDFRIRMAKELLTTTHLDMEQIAWRTGFASANTFIEAFRRTTDTTPKKYRTRYAITGV